MLPVAALPNDGRTALAAEAGGPTGTPRARVRVVLRCAARGVRPGLGGSVAAPLRYAHGHVGDGGGNGLVVVVIPKGFFPQQDTGLLLGVTFAAEDVSPDNMARIQHQVIETILKDPAVESVGAQIGAGGATSTENQGRVFINLKPRRQRPPIDQVMARIGASVRGVVGVRLFMQPVQDIVIGGRLSATQYQYTLTGIDLDELNKWAPIRSRNSIPASTSILSSWRCLRISTWVPTRCRESTSVRRPRAWCR